MASKMSPEVDPWATQVGGGHYVIPIQPFEYSMKNKLDPLQHSVVKYVTRFRDKSGEQDLRKAIHCLELLIAYEYGEKNAVRN